MQTASKVKIQCNGLSAAQAIQILINRSIAVSRQFAGELAIFSFSRKPVYTGAKPSLDAMSGLPAMAILFEIAIDDQIGPRNALLVYR
ncbi:hypothetical protein BI343_02330 [Chromobacterium amazonense]|nr:hypothetical protein BI343_02330 [Chromobacterium amazonense]